VPSEEPNITSVAVAEEGPAEAAVEGAEKKVSPEEYLDIQLKQLQRTKCARDDALVAENQFLRQLAREHGIVVPSRFAAVASSTQPLTTSQQATTSMDSAPTTNPVAEDIVMETQVCYINHHWRTDDEIRISRWHVVRLCYLILRMLVRSCT
jgi:hypothetical protein